MAKKRNNGIKHSECSLCGTQEGALHPCEEGFVCMPCIERGRAGRDTTTRATRAQTIAMTERVTASMYRNSGDPARASGHESGAEMYAKKSEMLFGTELIPERVAGGEVIHAKSHTPSWAVNTLTDPDVVAIDASVHRLKLLDRMGTDCAAMALDVADSIKAENSLEKMLAHQLAVAHKAALEIADKATFQQDVGDKARLFNLAARMMETFQRGLLTFDRIRSKGEQRIVVQHVNVKDGGQAIIGNVSREGGGGKDEK
ncbi:MAG: hypothetical protein M0Z73_13185 [Betaproteobacteria bacterium]|nr:hypothetical protein [Betaproteobacteria bacterium]